jgi:hypothetical protein
MTTRTWNTGTGSFFDPQHWTPAGVPRSGDTATIPVNSIVTVAGHRLDGIDIRLDGFSATPPPTLVLDRAVLGANLNIDVVHHGPRPGPPLSAITVNHFALNAGTISVGFPQYDFESANLSVTLEDNSVLVNTGLIRSELACRMGFSGGDTSVLVNNGDITGHGSFLTFDVPVIGSGRILAEASSGVSEVSSGPVATQLEFKQAVGPGETITLNGANLLLDAPMRFFAQIDDAPVESSDPSNNGTNSTITLVNQHATSESFEHGDLIVLDGCQVVARLRFADHFSAANFTLTDTAQGAVISIHDHGWADPASMPGQTQAFAASLLPA